jgi:NAD(P)-dependent dehydrogenase (short-subunit alcohol dehydrogenase family)
MPKAPGQLNGRVALISGASRGIGAALAKRYAAEGAQVVLMARTQAGLEEVDDAIRRTSDGMVQATLVPIDLKNGDDIDRLAAAVAERFGKLDIMVANAAVLGDMSPVSHIEPADWDDVIAVNLTANWRLVRALEALLLKSDAGRAIFLTSGVAGGRAYWGSYAITKTAIEALARTWAEEMDNTSLRINTVNPGRVRTAMRAKAYPGEDPATLSSPDDITDIFVELAMPHCMRHGEILNAQ